MEKITNPYFDVINATGRVFFIGDLHGHYDAFVEACQRVGFRPDQGDIVVSTGDLIDRGPDNLRCLELLNEPWFYAVQGNHEELATTYLKHPGCEPLRRNWAMNGGRWFGKLPTVKKARAQHLLLTVVDALPFALEVRMPNGLSYGVLHAEPPVLDWARLPGMLESDDNRVYATWSRKRIRHLEAQMNSGTTPDRRIQHVENIDAVISGHTIMKNGHSVWGNCFYIDSGAFLGNPLTMLSDTDIERGLTQWGDKTYREHYDAMIERLDNEWDEKMQDTRSVFST